MRFLLALLLTVHLSAWCFAAAPTTGTPTEAHYFAAGSTTDLVVDAPTHSEGDVLVAFIRTANTSSATITAPSGWVEKTHVAIDIAVDGHGYIFTKVATGSEPSTYTFTMGTAFDIARIVVVPVSGAADPASIAVVTATATDTDTSGTYTSPAVTVTDDDSLVIRYASSYNSGDSYTAPTGHSEIFDNGGAQPSVSLATKTYNAGSTGTVAWTNTNTWDEAFLMTIALAPPASASAVPVIIHNDRIHR